MSLGLVFQIIFNQILFQKEKCTRLKITPAIARVILLLTDDFACVLDEADEIGLTS